LDARSGTEFFAIAMREFGLPAGDNPVRVLDWGCGKGELVAAFKGLGMDAHGCDFGDRLGGMGLLRSIEREPYRLPFDDETFHYVVSVNVLEHAQNVEESYREIRRVLKPGGVAMHMFPAKWYLPTEPHFWVPLMNWFWPWRPRVWLALWALLGVRKTNQRGKSWRAVVDENDAYLRDHCSYRSSRHHRRASMEVFGNCAWPMRFYVDHAPGGVGRLARRLPFRGLSGAISREFRVAFLLQRNDPQA